MGHKARRCLLLWAAAGVTLASVISLSESYAQGPYDALAPYNQPGDVRVQRLENIINGIHEKVIRATTEIELTAVETVVSRFKQGQLTAFKARMGDALRRWTTCRNDVVRFEQRIEALTTAIAAERAKMSGPTPTAEEGALEGVITQSQAELAELEGRQQRVPSLEAQLQAMPRTGFMESAPRERLEADLAQARANLPRPGVIEKARRDLAAYQAQLQSQRATRPRPNDSELMRLEQQKGVVEAARLVELNCAEEQKKAFIRLRAQALGFVEFIEWLEAFVDGRRQALAGVTGTPSAFVQCLTMQGPFKCTGAFDGTWSTRCTTTSGTNEFHGPAKVTFGPDGWVEVRMTSATAQQGEQPTIVGGRIAPDGTVVVNRTSGGRSEIYRGQFKLVTTTLASGAAKPIGSGTYENVVKSANGQDIIRCSGSMKLI